MDGNFSHCDLCGGRHDTDDCPRYDQLINNPLRQFELYFLSELRRVWTDDINFEDAARLSLIEAALQGDDYDVEHYLIVWRREKYKQPEKNSGNILTRALKFLKFWSS